jgi:hypothetical protein
MSGDSNGRAEAVAVSKAKPPARGRETRELLERASQGDRGCLPEVWALLDDDERGPSYRESWGSPAEWLRESIIAKATGGNPAIREAMIRKLESVQADLAVPDPTPMERLLAERAAICWMLVNWYEDSFHNAKEMSIARANHQQGKIDRAHARFLSAVRALAQVRKLALPTLQVNIARNQVNVAGTRS